MNRAVDCAKLGFGQTFPNPAVGCVIVDQESNKVLGKGFHPRAGMPHAEVFALFEAAGYVPDGVEAAKSVVKEGGGKKNEQVENLAKQYIDNPSQLLENAFDDTPVTAYVTLEPCCHSGKRTPPCASSLVLAKVDRVVVGLRDPNPKVNGGGVKSWRTLES
jgi:diaminohydroxyphosphoribosylaminopyrimidine deaminase/5-amino-6-(5-phosphoribosylamino)uracil reductase